MKGATNVGVTLIRYRELLGTLASEVAIAADGAKRDNEKEMVGMYAAALMNYKDVATVWAAKIQHGSESLPAYLPEVDEIATKYRLPKEPNLSADNAIQSIWSEAGKNIDTANALYNGHDTIK